MKYLDIILLFVSKHSTFNFPNSQYLKIFWFNIIDFMCFGDKRNAGICVSEIIETQELFSIPPSPWPFSSFQKINKKNLLRQILWYIYTVDYFKKQCFNKLFFTAFSIFKDIVFLKSTEFELKFALRIPIVNS